MENVEGLLDDKNIHGLQDGISLIDKRYTILSPIIIDSSEYGAPTKRLRVIVVGFDGSRMETIDETDIYPLQKISSNDKEAILTRNI